LELDEDEGGGAEGVAGAEAALLRRRRGRPPKARLECPVCDKTAADPAYLAEHFNHWHFGKALTDKQITVLKEAGVPVRLARGWVAGHGVVAKLGEGVPLVEVVRPAGLPGASGGAGVAPGVVRKSPGAVSRWERSRGEVVSGVKSLPVPVESKPPGVLPGIPVVLPEPPAAGVGLPAGASAQTAPRAAKEPAGGGEADGAGSFRREVVGGLAGHPTGLEGGVGNGVVKEPSIEKALALWKEAVNTAYVLHVAKVILELREADANPMPVIVSEIRHRIAQLIGVPQRYLDKQYARFNINAQVATLVRCGSLDAHFMSRSEYRKWYPGQEGKTLHAYTLPTGEVVGTRLSGRRAPGEVKVTVVEVGVDENGAPYVRLKVEAIVPTGIEKEVKVLL